MSRPNVKRYKNQKVSPGDKDQLFDYLGNELNTIVSEFDDSLKRALTFEDNFAGKVVTFDLTAGEEVSIPNQLGKIPSGFIVLDGSVPSIVKGTVWNRTTLSFNSTHYVKADSAGNLTIDTVADVLAFSEPVFQNFTPGMAVSLNLVSGVMPTGIVDGQKYYVIESSSYYGFSLSSEPNGRILNITTTGPALLRIAATGTVKILLLR